MCPCSNIHPSEVSQLNCRGSLSRIAGLFCFNFCRMQTADLLPSRAVSDHTPLFGLTQHNSTHCNHEHSRRHWRIAERLCRVSVSSAIAIDCRTDRDFRLYKSSKHSDCKINCGSYTFHAHKAVICSQSVYFDTALKSSTFKVRHPTSAIARPSLTEKRRERQELSSWQQRQMTLTALTLAMIRKL